MLKPHLRMGFAPTARALRLCTATSERGGNEGTKSPVPSDTRQHRPRHRALRKWVVNSLKPQRGCWREGKHGDDDDEGAGPGGGPW